MHPGQVRRCGIVPLFCWDRRPAAGPGETYRDRHPAEGPGETCCGDRGTYRPWRATLFVSIAEAVSGGQAMADPADVALQPKRRVGALHPPTLS